jgi:hypothetical protein
MVDDEDDQPEVSLLFAVAAAGTCLPTGSVAQFCENAKFMTN